MRSNAKKITSGENEIEGYGGSVFNRGNNERYHWYANIWAKTLRRRGVVGGDKYKDMWEENLRWKNKNKIPEVADVYCV